MITGIIFRDKERGGVVVGVDVPEGTNPEYVSHFMRGFFNLSSALPYDHKTNIAECPSFSQQKKRLDEDGMQ